MTLTSAKAWVGGRIGNQLFVEVKGKGTLGLFASVELVLLDGSGKEVLAFDSDWDGVPDSGRGRLVPDAKPTTESFTVTVVLEGAAAFADLQDIDVALFDRKDAKTTPTRIAVARATERTEGQSCDPAFIKSHCKQGFSCQGTPAECVAGIAPTVNQGAYQRGSGTGPFMRLRGEDPDEDVMMVRVDFLTASNEPIRLDLTGDDIPDDDKLEVLVGVTNRDGAYTFDVESAPIFEQQVPRVGLTAIDSRSNKSETKYYSLSTRTIRQVGQTCDLGGFDTCATGSSCIASSVTDSSYCTSLSQAQNLACTAAPVWNLGTEPLRYTGTISGASLWAPPTDCMNASPFERPEALVKIRLPKAVSVLTLSTDVPETQQDTVIYVQSACSATGTQVLGCSDEFKGYTSSVTLTNLDAGDYFVLVEFVQGTTGAFGLRAVMK